MNETIYEVESFIEEFVGVVHYFVLIEKQEVAQNGDILEDILIKLWVNEEFDAYNIMQALSEDKSLQQEVQRMCGEDSFIKYENHYV